jgi:predicted  nucleic acid-binding Zn-ribbon protein
MENTNKITAEQLETIVTQQKDLQALLTNIGLAESQKHAFLHQLAEINKAVEDFKMELQDQYGAININLEDGSYDFIEESDAEVVEAEEVN